MNNADHNGICYTSVFLGGGGGGGGHLVSNPSIMLINTPTARPRHCTKSPRLRGDGITLCALCHHSLDTSFIFSCIVNNVSTILG